MCCGFDLLDKTEGRKTIGCFCENLKGAKSTLSGLETNSSQQDLTVSSLSFALKSMEQT